MEEREIYLKEINSLNKQVMDLYHKFEVLDHYVFELENRITELEKNNINNIIVINKTIR